MDKVKPSVYVEGKDDENAIVHILKRHEKIENVQVVKECQGRTGLLKAIGVSVPAAVGKSLGFVLDANSDLAGTWQAVRSRLACVGVTAPDLAPENGFIGQSGLYLTRVGIWVMPDNRRNGALEDFLLDLVDPEDPLMMHADSATKSAKRHGARYNDRDADKAMLHTWLAWQKKPGLPYGSAIGAGFLKKDSVTALGFVDWFSRLAPENEP